MKFNDNTTISYYILLLLVVIANHSCIDPLNLTLEDKGEFLVIDGFFSTDKGEHLFKLYYATGQRVNARTEVSGADITLFENGKSWLKYSEISKGVYRVVTSEKSASVGNNYHIHITLSNGEMYASHPEKMPVKVFGEKVFFDFLTKPEVNEHGFSFKRPYIDIYLATQLPTDIDFWLKWDMQTIYGFPEAHCSPLIPPKICYISKPQNPQEINLFNGAALNTAYLPRQYLAEKRLSTLDAEFRNKHYFLVNQKSITQEAHEYWRKINTITNQTGSIFDAPPAYVPGNVFNVNRPEETVLGYFEVANVDSLRASVIASDFRQFYRFPENLCQAGNPLNLFERACCNCEILDNVTFERPSWW